jgi:4-amino-4-deoxy-L-arabinose transferase-like glycosyltransferase
LRDTVYFDFLLWDERIFHDWAAQIASGEYASTAVYEFPPLAAYLFAAVYELLGADALWIRLLNVALGSVLIALVYFITKEMFDRIAAAVAGLGAVLYGELVLYSAVPLKTTLGLVLFTSCVLLLLKTVRTRSHLGAIGLGIAAGLTATVRPNALVLLPVLVAAPAVVARWRGSSTRRGALAAAMVAAGICIATAPFVARNYLAAGEATLMTSQSGFNFYVANDLDSPVPYFHPLPFATTSPYEQGAQFTIEASRRSGRTLTSEEASSYWIAETLARMAERPGATVIKWLSKSLAALNRHEQSYHYHVGFISEHAPVLGIPFIGWVLIFPLGVAGFALRRGRPEQRAALAAVFAVYALTLVAYHTTTRYRILLAIVLLPFAASAVVEVVRRVRARATGRLLYPGIAAAVAALLAWLPIHGSGDLTSHWNNRALILKTLDRDDEAVECWERSAALGGTFSDFARQSLANLAFASGDRARAAELLEQIADDSYVAAQKRELLGDLALQRGNRERASIEYERSLAINSGRLPPHQKLIRLYAPTDRERVIEHHRQLLEIKAFYGRQL